ncbi:tubulin delta chain-like [Pelobates cultripes]|uniref:Tubulin delta chain-like n=1 Tax=Pelobates cultripes TaxID=61616 RepID=A0AAD1RV29_PELCU|nr:tubulin delta chain-like [Pelobates cultripes]
MSPILVVAGSPGSEAVNVPLRPGSLVVKQLMFPPRPGSEEVNAPQGLAVKQLIAKLSPAVCTRLFQRLKPDCWTERKREQLGLWIQWILHMCVRALGLVVFSGFGLGAHLCEEIRDTYPAGHILSMTVAPHENGETPLQHYNSLLCLAWLQRYCDGVLLFQNDDVLRRAADLTEKKMPMVSGLQPVVSLRDMNTYIASCLVGLLYPVHSLATRSSVSIGLEPWEIIRTLCPMSTMKFLQTAQVNRRGTAFWDRVTSSITQTIPRVSPEGHMHHSLSVLAAVRSSQDNSFLIKQDSVLNKLKQAYRCVPWNPRPMNCWIDTENILDPSCHSHSLTVCANHSSAADLISRVRQRALAMYSARAYLHWYRRYGCEDEDFESAFCTLSGVVEEYRHLGQQ